MSAPAGLDSICSLAEVEFVAGEEASLTDVSGVADVGWATIQGATKGNAVASPSITEPLATAA